MSNIYPSLEDMKYHQMTKAQLALDEQNRPILTQVTNGSLYPHCYPIQPPPQPPLPLQPPPYPSPSAPTLPSHNQLKLYPNLKEYMGLELTPIHSVTAYNGANSNSTETVPHSSGPNGVTMIAPFFRHGMQKAQVHHGIRELFLCKDIHGKIGLRVAAIHEGVFVCLVQEGSPAALVGLRFGDQILQINGKTVAGSNMTQVHSLLKNCPINNISIIVRDRPFERNVTLHKDSSGQVGFQFKKGQIIRLVKESSASRNGLLTDHHILEVNGQNVVGLKDKEIRDIVEKAACVINLTIMPSTVYHHMMNKMNFNLVRNTMDHSI
uniref:Syntenin-1 n=1 Tax=Cacopsylla melanoneura TaxID=428564 RepID=A0A8D8Q8F3_9HEMI